MTKKFAIVKGQREYTYTLQANREYCVSGSGTFTLEVMHHGETVYALIMREDYVQLPEFDDQCQLKIVGRDTMEFTVFVSDNRLIGG